MSRIRKHQADQKASFREWVGSPARRPVPAQGARGTIVSATGSGKTITAAACALECFPGARILVTVPALDLLVQTAQAWLQVGHRSPMVAARSLEKDAVLERLRVGTTTYASPVDRDDPDAPHTGGPGQGARAA